MARYVGTITSPWPAEKVFDYMADFSSVAEWDPSAKRARVVEGTPGEVGTKFEVTVSSLGRETVLVYETKAIERPNRIVLRAETGTLISEDVVTVRSLGESTELTYDADLRMKGPLGLGDPILRIFFNRLANKAADGLRAKLGASE